MSANIRKIHATERGNDPRASVNSHTPMSGPAVAVDAESRPVAIGDRVEARRHGRGTAYLPGRVTAIHHDRGTGAAAFSIEYDDGEFEQSAVPANVFRLASDNAQPGGPRTSMMAMAHSSPSARPQGTDADGQSLLVGDRAEARYKGKGTLFYSGVVKSIHRQRDDSITFTLSYDGGEVEEGIIPSNIRRIDTGF